MTTQNISVTLITQGEHKFYSGTMEIELISLTCSTNPREDDPDQGFQRTLDESRAKSIAGYIRNGGTIPSSIILSAQPESELTYNSKNKTITFNEVQGSFLILDGQHRAYGFRKLLKEGVKYRVPVIIYNGLTPMQEARIFIDINTLQRPVPKELLLDIKRLADRESDDERMLDELFTSFETEPDSYLLNKLSRIDKQRGKISKVTFYDSMKPMLKEFNISSTERLYRIINTFLLAANDISEENQFNLEIAITKATLFKILLAHSRAIISIISDNNSDDIDKISEHKKYLIRSLPGSFQDIANSKAYLKSVELLDRKLLRRNLTI
ncbi:DGQHR domain-containing protein [Acidithiobacillus thiooxidans]|nr:DGQHR domain-containing protein [Acidithiobacillus thiooxidans]MBU2792862.1 DGQHR domain-containing protein [Acidithiobacillus thiooxidans]